ncbi:hypothetical protein JMJ77_0006095 [Colletotrichum scovillei]|uniref:Uncharacterized protein n=1 Tax=Colletotrichum scovillei TaxID=1209932 RepID=A0A9P7RJK6_9PEZI|nr:hypothetical protein JMJ77_0006095 [Colletotrichum scovillei]KAG7077327.1 hypothetical protein JMJ76_0014575 [Colletotrichum scovillei]KAG7084441.1 hypothetical protein JMJ78_0009876 [Colletotrichum scovillei]
MQVAWQTVGTSADFSSVITQDITAAASNTPRKWSGTKSVPEQCLCAPRILRTSSIWNKNTHIPIRPDMDAANLVQLT